MTRRELKSRLGTLLPRTGLRGHVVTLLSGSTVAIALSYIAQPLLTRLYSPTDFGTLDVFVAVVASVGPLLSLRYEDAILIPERDDDAAAVLWLSVFLSVLLAALSFVLVPLSHQLAALLDAPSFAGWIALLPPALVLFRVVKLTEQWLKRKKRFRSLSAADVTLTLSTVGTRLTAALLVTGVGAIGLIGGYIAGFLSTATLVVVLAARVNVQALRDGLDVQRVLHALRRYRRFPAFSTPALLLKSATAVLPTFLLLAFFDERVVGHYGRAFMVASAPLVMIGKAVGKVYHAEAARRLYTGGITELTSSIHRRMVILGLFPILVLMLAGPAILTIVLGAEWTPTGRYLRYLGPWLFLTAVTVPFGSIFDLLERQRGDLLLSALMFVLQTSALVLAARTGDVTLALLALGIAGFLVRSLHLTTMMYLAHVPRWACFRDYLLAASTAAPLLLPVLLANTYASPLVVCGVAALSGVAYLALAWRQGWL